MNTADPSQLLASPRFTSQNDAKKTSLFAPLALVSGFGIALSIMFLIGYLTKAYPPSAEELKVWIEAWGAWAMTPVVNIPMESYRLFLAIITVPLVLTTWALMAGSARLLSYLMKGRASFVQYLRALAFSFFPFWILSALVDTIYSGVFGGYITPALQMEYGATARAFFLYFAQIMYPVILGAGMVFNFRAIRRLEGFSAWKAATIAIITGALPILATATLFR